MLANCRLAAGHRGELRMVFTQRRDPGQHGVRGQAGLEHPFGYFLAISQQPFVANAQASSSASVDADLAAHGLGHFSHYRLAAQGRLKLAGPALGLLGNLRLGGLSQASRLPLAGIGVQTERGAELEQGFAQAIGAQGYGELGFGQQWSMEIQRNI